jgi:cytidylate kinase
LKISTIAIDGPAASGKSTVGELLARRLGYLYFDTGVMYRAVTWAALDRGIPIEDEAAVVALAGELRIDVTPPTADDGRQYTVLADGVDITWEIRTPAVSGNVSAVSAYPGVRREMVRQQRCVAKVSTDGVVMVGRDIGTVVLPDADLKIYLDASVEERARRRWREELARGENSDYEAVLVSMRRRDEIDSSREASPLRAAEDAVVLDTTDLSIEQVISAVERLIGERAVSPPSQGGSRPLAVGEGG